ncbi:hypothetical protein CWI42_031020 [Ordospora colligata]|uniref:Uncharacterized protein n=1 Tax=Ordospora colligata OC4 TaxID=1354746 RepID=A0A0B2UG77_9MICR|nr:uncharacterized protein M896_030730 [Ordospora colligata OC4]KHN70086.1 hypothetical protein M896_030730 [Ordospora colligata OC4]TBU16468.1 hypothetical protein CWI41_030690 [Ordospora colligata]TBU16653.1 hypothetical protein CWI40_031090 [Ordospora colligata]TBU19226.1 hypothetical protein CWI42_031020 [Ordospora colligata]
MNCIRKNLVHDQTGIFNVLSKLSISDGLDMNEYVCEETLQMIFHVYRRRLYRSASVRKVLAKMAFDESDEIEKMVYEMLCRRRIVFRNYLLKLSFMKAFPRFKRFFVDEDYAEYRMQVLVHKLRYMGRDVVGNIEKEILRIPDDKICVYLDVISSYIHQDIVMNVMDKVGNCVKAKVGKYLDEDLYYERICEVLLGVGIEEKEEILRAMMDINWERFYLSLLECCRQRYMDRKSFDGFLDVMRLSGASKEMRIALLNGWMNGLVYFRRLGEFVKVFESVKERMDVNGVFERLYDAIRRYKKSGKLDLDGFFEGCDGMVNERFELYSWREICEVYRYK